MAKKYDYTFTIGDKSHQFNKNENQSSSFTNFDMSTKNRTVRVSREMGVNKNYNIVEENMEYNPILSKNIKGNIFFI